MIDRALNDRALPWPNLLTAARLALVPLGIGLVLHAAYGWALLVIAAAALTDAADGFLARRYRLTTALGAVLDPLADKALVGGAFLSLAVMGAVSPALTALVVLRDVAIAGVVGWCRWSGRRLVIAPSRLGKLNTLIQLLFVTGTLAVLALGRTAPGWALAAEMGVAVMTLVSGLDYLARWRHLPRAPR